MKKNSKPSPRVQHRGRVTIAPRQATSEAMPTIEELERQRYEISGVGQHVGPEIAGSMDSKLLPDVFDTDAVILRDVLDRFCPGYAGAIRALEDYRYPDMTLAVYERFENHLTAEDARLRAVQQAQINASLGRNGLVTVPGWAGTVSIPSPTRFAHMCGPQVPQTVAYETIKEIVGTYRQKMLAVQASESGVGYEEAEIASTLVDFLTVQKAKRVQELKVIMEDIESLLEVRHVPEEDGIRIEYKVLNYSKLPFALQRLKRECGRMITDFASWFLADMDGFLKKTFFWTEEQNVYFMKKHFTPLYIEMADAIREAGEQLATQYVRSADEQSTPDAVPVESLVFQEQTAPHSDESVEHLIPAEAYQVELTVPWLVETPGVTRHGLVGFKVNGHGIIYVASALTKELSAIAERSSRTLMDPETFNRLTVKAVKGVASGKRYGLEKGWGNNPTPYDDFMLHKEDGGSSGNASRLYFAVTRVREVVAELPEGLSADGRLLIVVAKTDKDGQDRVLEIINGSPKRTAKRRGAGK